MREKGSGRVRWRDGGLAGVGHGGAFHDVCFLIDVRSNEAVECARMQNCSCNSTHVSVENTSVKNGGTHCSTINIQPRVTCALATQNQSIKSRLKIGKSEQVRHQKYDYIPVSIFESSVQRPASFSLN